MLFVKQKWKFKKRLQFIILNGLIIFGKNLTKTKFRKLDNEKETTRIQKETGQVKLDFHQHR